MDVYGAKQAKSLNALCGEYEGFLALEFQTLSKQF